MTYLRRTPRWIVVSGYRGDMIFYRRSALGCGDATWFSVALDYPRAQKRALDAVVTTVSRGLAAYAADCTLNRPQRPASG